MFNTNSYNPDVLSCIANLSSDEVFTPPQLVNRILDLLPDTLWSDQNATFLDPGCKSGVFLREIARRLNKGLEAQIPDRQIRINHIFKNQLFGLPITELTALLSRRSVYCSKTANSKYSICEAFDNPEGNIRFGRVEHTWENGRCLYCGANKENYERGGELESHAYAFIHTYKPEEIFNMKFDVIIGNPPYQLSDGGFGDSAGPIYHLFIEQAKKLNPCYLTMIVPARWYAGGKGLDTFRENMLNDRRLTVIHDFPETGDCFPGLNIRGGVCYFLWTRDRVDDCEVTNYAGGKPVSKVKRPLLEEGCDVFIRYNSAISILRKVAAKEEPSFIDIVSSRKPFGLPTNFSDFSSEKTSEKSVLLYRFGECGYVSRSQVLLNQSWIDKFKVLVAKASPGGDYYPHQVISSPIVARPESCCTETYLVAGTYTSELQAVNAVSYLNTRFVRFLILLIKNTQDVPRKVYRFVPKQDFSNPWSDEKLYKKYRISENEAEFIKLLVRGVEE